MDGGDAVLVGELAHKTKPADTASETSSLPEQKGFRGFVLLDTQDFTGEPKIKEILGDCSVQALRKVGSKPMKARSSLHDCSEWVS